MGTTKPLKDCSIRRKFRVVRTSDISTQEHLKSHDGKMDGKCVENVLNIVRPTPLKGVLKKKNEWGIALQKLEFY